MHDPSTHRSSKRFGLFHTLLGRRALAPASSRNPERRPSRPRLEMLEDRTLPSLAAAVGPNVDVIKLTGNQHTSAIAINPTNFKNLVVAAAEETTSGIVVATSQDGGATWSSRQAATGTDGLTAAFGDPQVAFDNFGNLFLSYLGTDGSVDVALSTDGGQTLSPLVSFTPPSGGFDRPSIATGAGSVWVSFTDNNNNVEAAGATVSGLGASQISPFSTKVIPSSTGGDFGSIAVGPNGQVLVTFQYGLINGPGPDVIVTSLDPTGVGGTFGNPVTVTNTMVGGFDENIPAQSNLFGIDAEANLAWDRTGGANRGRVYLVYTDAPFTTSSSTKIYLRYSNDNGTTWSNAIPVFDSKANGNSEFLPSISLDPTSGAIGVAWYDARNDLGNHGPGDTDGTPNDDAQLFGAFSNDGGNTFSSNAQISAGTSNSADSEPAGANHSALGFGSFGKSDFLGGSFFRVWADNSNSAGGNPDGTLSKLDVYTAKVTILNATAPTVTPPTNQNTNEGTNQSFSLGSFTDPDSSPWSVSVNWGDSTANTNFSTSTPGSLGNQAHTFGEEGVYTVTVSVTNSVNQSNSATYKVTVADVPVLGASVSVSGSPNMSFSPSVATFTDPGGPEPNSSDPNPNISSHYSASINWGDNSSATAGTITYNPTTHQFTVSGVHNYSAANTYNITTNIFHESTTSVQVRSPASIGTTSGSVPTVTPPGNQNAVEGTAQLISLGSFSESGGNGPWNVSINWGDGSTNMTFSETTAGSLGAQPHNFGEEGIRTVTVTVTDNKNASNFASFQVTVSDPAVVGSGVNVITNPNTSFSGPVATFTDPGGAEPNSNDPDPVLNDHYNATVDWGDGTLPTPDTITFNPATQKFTVNSSHIYSNNGSFTITTTITHESAPSLRVQSLAAVGNTSGSGPTVSPPVNQNAAEGSSALLGLGSFSESGNGPWNVSINWGDNTPNTTFSRSAPGTLGSQLHTFGEEGIDTVTVTVTDSKNVANFATFQVTVSDPAVVASGVNVNTSLFTFFTMPVATFTDPGGPEPNASDSTPGIASHYSATIDWGDSTGVTPDTISFNPVNHQFTVTSSHTYFSNGPFTITTTIMHESAPNAVVHSQATIGNSSGSGPTVTAAANQNATEGTLQSFSLGSFTESTSNGPWSVSVSWGDGTPNTSFTATATGNLANQPHTFREEGTYNVTVNVTDHSNQSNSASFQVTVADPAVVGTGASIGFTPNKTFAAGVATFTDPGAPEPNTSDPDPNLNDHYSATIDWGDNTGTVPGAIGFDTTTQQFSVSASH
ncbi:MAG TPA: PKD domain-containing protein, partial [Gemmataceae bacterium]|nr:PKD domain-containing protein [Gemmataceae bacterium]